MSVTTPETLIERQHAIYQTARSALPSSYGLHVYHRIREGEDVQSVLSSAPDGTARFPTVIEVAPGLYKGSFFLPTSNCVLVAPRRGAVFLKDNETTMSPQDVLGDIGYTNNDSSTLHAGSRGIEVATALDPVLDQWIIGLTVVNTRTGQGVAEGGPPEPALSVGNLNVDQKWSGIYFFNNDIIGSHDALQLFGDEIDGYRARCEVAFNRMKTNHDCYTLKSPGIDLWSHHNILRCLSADTDDNFSSLLPIPNKWKCTGIHFNEGTGGIDTRFRFSNEIIHIRVNDHVALAGDQSCVAGILMYSAFDMDTGFVEFENCSILIEYDFDFSPSNGVSGIQVRAPAAEGLVSFSGNIAVHQLNTGVDAPDTVQAVSVPDSGEVSWLKASGLAEATNAKAASAAYAVNAGGADSHVRHALYSDQDILVSDGADVAAMSLAAVP